MKISGIFPLVNLSPQVTKSSENRLLCMAQLTGVWENLANEIALKTSFANIP